MKQYFVANEIPAAKQAAAFISTIGVMKAYKTLQDILAPADPCCSAQLDTLCNALSNHHYSPKSLQLAVNVLDHTSAPKGPRNP